MKWFYNLKISSKLLITFCFMAIIAGALGIFGIVNVLSTNNAYSDLYETNGISQGVIGKVAADFRQTRITLRDILIDRGSTDRGKYVDKLKVLDEDMNKQMALFEPTLKTEEEKKEFADLKVALAGFIAIREKVANLALANEEDEAIRVTRTEAVEVTETADQKIVNLTNLKTTQGRELANQLSANTVRTRTIMIVVIVIAMLLAVAFGIFISRIIGNPIKKLINVADKIADGNLEVIIDINTKDELGILAGAFSKMADNLNEVMSNINTASEQVSSGSKQVSDSSIALSQGATEQASSIEELTASIEEISVQTTKNAGNADQANILALKAKENADQGNNQMKEMLKAMEEINISSSNISKIIKVIDEIAFQTNILALNAAVEAARAGQHGKGFAVVAEEVRNLAARSANAAKETTDLIEGSIKKVEGGTKIANATALALNNIVEDVAKAATLVNDIAVASNEQATGINQINQGIMQVSQVVQTNSATSEESAAASEELSSQAELLKQQVDRFKLRRNNLTTNRKIEGISPEILKMLENMSDKKKYNDSPVNEAYKEAALTTNRIALSDTEFGKY